MIGQWWLLSPNHRAGRGMSRCWHCSADRLKEETIDPGIDEIVRRLSVNGTF